MLTSIFFSGVDSNDQLNSFIEQIWPSLLLCCKARPRSAPITVGVGYLSEPDAWGKLCEFQLGSFQPFHEPKNHLSNWKGNSFEPNFHDFGFKMLIFHGVWGFRSNVAGR